MKSVLGVERLIPARSPHNVSARSVAAALQRSHVVRSDTLSRSASSARKTKSVFRIKNDSEGKPRIRESFLVHAAGQGSAAGGQPAVRTALATDGRPLADVMAGISLLSLDGGEVAITSLWENQRAVVAWARHFG